MKTTRVGGGHPDYRVLADATQAGADRVSDQQDPWHYTIARMVDACAANGLKPFYESCRLATSLTWRHARRSSATPFCSVALAPGPYIPVRSRSPKRCFRLILPRSFARKILKSMPDGSGGVMIDGKMQDDATWKQARVVVDLARQVAAKDAEYAALYQF